MDVFQAIKNRRSIRDYSDKPIPKDILEQIIDAARFAPTARGVEPWHFVVVTQADMLKKVADATDHGKFIGKAAACIAVFCEDTKYYLEDGCAAIQNILLAATAIGIGSCWVAGDKKPYCDSIKEVLNIPSSYWLVGLVSLGYPGAGGAFFAGKRKGLKDLLHWQKY